MSKARVAVQKAARKETRAAEVSARETEPARMREEPVSWCKSVADKSGARHEIVRHQAARTRTSREAGPCSKTGAGRNTRT
jgi:hypothetical protein